MGAETLGYVGSVARDVDVSLLSEEERAEYAMLLAAVGRTGRGRAGAVLVVSLVAALALVGVAFATSRPSGQTLLENLVGFLGLGVGGFGLYWSVMLNRDAEHRRVARAREVDNFLRRIMYSSRSAQRGADGSGEGGALMSRRQMQHQWYGDHPELGRRDRELGETLGVDADTYVSNILEHDKD